MIKSKSKINVERILHRHPVLTLDTWLRELGGKPAAARERVRYYADTGRLRSVARGVYLSIPPGADPAAVQPDPYLLAASLRPDAILSHHAALDLLGVSRSTFHRYTYFTASVRRPLRVDGDEWIALQHPRALVRAGRVDVGVRTLDRQGAIVRFTTAERTLVDGFAAPAWAGGLEEHVESCAALRDLDPKRLDQYLELLDQKLLYAAVGWFVERYPSTIEHIPNLIRKWKRRIPRQPLYLGSRSAGGKLQSTWNIVLPETLAQEAGFEGTPDGA